MASDQSTSCVAPVRRDPLFLALLSGLSLRPPPVLAASFGRAEGALFDFAALPGFTGDLVHVREEFRVDSLCEGNAKHYFRGLKTPDALQKRDGLSENGTIYRQDEFDERFGQRHPNETDYFGWAAEISLWNLDAVPVKRTTLDRIN